MSNPLRIALAQFDFPVGAVDANSDRIIALIEQAKQHKADLVVFPELAISGYPPEDLLSRPSFLQACEKALLRIAENTHDIVTIVGWPQAAGSVVFNAVSVLRNGCIEATYRKRELPNYAVFDERRHFATGDSVCTFDIDGLSIGLLICEDVWFSEPLQETVAAGAQLVLVPNASPFERDKLAERDALLTKRVRETGVAIAYLNAVGGQDELVFDGASILADADGKLHPAARAFEDHLLLTDYDHKTHKFLPINWPAENDESRESLAYRAIVRGIADYCRKNGFKTAWIGLSGGIDSALVVAMAADALGAGNVRAVRLPSRFTSDLSNDLATEQAQALGIRLDTISIEKPFQGFIDALAPLFADVSADVTEENLQSRCRGATLMALSNKFGGLLLTTGNKSEYAVGYATIYGDMCGGYAPIKDLYKTEVFALSRWRNAQQPTGAAEAIPTAVIDRPPSAELRENQTDQDSLPPYAVLDDLLFKHVDERHSRAELLADGFDEATVDKILKLVRISEWKRRQSAPGPKVSRRAFGRERRYPITSGWGK